MKRTLAIARLTFQEGIRMRIVVVLVLLLVFIVLRLPFALRGDETLSGRLQTFLSYSLGAVSLLMCLATVFFSCATLCNEFQTRTLHLVLTKPVHRFEVLVGKWLGVNLLNLLIVGVAAVAIYGLAVFIKNQPVSFERDRYQVRDVIWTARLAATPTEPDFRQAAEAAVNEMIERGEAVIQDRDQAVEQKIKEFREQWLQVPPGERRVYVFENLAPPETPDTAYQIRFKVRGIPLPPREELRIQWYILHPKTGAVLAVRETQERVEQVHYFLVRGSVVVDGKAALGIVNPGNPVVRRSSTIYFEGRDALQILYKVGAFEPNYIKAVLLILFRLAFLSAVGLLFGTFTTFPVACFCTLSIYLFCLGMPWWLHSIGADLKVVNPQIDPYGALGPLIRTVLVPLLTTLLPNFMAYDGVGRLIEGHLIVGGLVLKSAVHTLLYGTLLLALPGWLVFRSREIAGVIL